MDQEPKFAVIRLTDEDKERIRNFANQKRLSISSFCRLIVLEKIGEMEEIKK